MNFRFFTRFLDRLTGKQQQNKNMKKYFFKIECLFSLLLHRERKKNWMSGRKINFMNHSQFFFVYCVCAVKAILCTWQCLHTKNKQKRLIRRECKNLSHFLLDCHVVASLSCFTLQSIILLCWWMKWERDEKCTLRNMRAELWTL